MSSNGHSPQWKEYFQREGWTQKGEPLIPRCIRKSLSGQFSCCFTSQKVAFQLPALVLPRETKNWAALLPPLVTCWVIKVCEVALFLFFFFSFFFPFSFLFPFFFWFVFKSELSWQSSWQWGGQGQVKIHLQPHREWRLWGSFLSAGVSQTHREQQNWVSRCHFVLHVPTPTTQK